MISVGCQEVEGVAHSSWSLQGHFDLDFLELAFWDLWKYLVVGFRKCLPRKVRFSAPFLLNCRTRSHHYYSAIKLKYHVLHYQQLLLLESKIMLHTTE